MSSISFDRATDYYDATRGYPPGVAERVADAIVAATGATSATRFLELGIGTGRIAFPLIVRGYPYAGIDISEPMMARLRAKLAAYTAAHPDQPPPQVDLRVGDSTRLPYPDAAFDVVLAVHVLHLIPNWRAALDEALRVLTPGGVYLNGNDDAVTLGSHQAVQRMWFAILKRLGYDTGALGMAGYATWNEIEHYLQARGLATEVTRPVTWPTSETPRQALQFIAQRLWSRTWVIPDDIFAESARLLEAEVTARYGDHLDTPEQRERQFVLMRARKRA
jgi:ubiquinone/menaquinone biosynthesis C-methylase UbiE